MSNNKAMDEIRNVLGRCNINDLAKEIVLRDFDKAVSEFSYIQNKEGEYWRKRCEAAESVITFMKFDNTSYPECVEEDFERFTKGHQQWQLLKSQPADNQRIIEGL